MTSFRTLGSAKALVLLILGSLPLGLAVKTEALSGGANPIRKVVTMLEKISENIQKEVEEEKETFDKFTCYCKKELADFGMSEDQFRETVPKLEAEIETMSAEIASATEEIEKLKKTREDLIGDMNSAAAQREKENDAYLAELAELKANIEALETGIKALNNTVGASSLLQTASAFSELSETQKQRIQQAVDRSKTVSESDRNEFVALLQGEAENNPGQVQGILEVNKEDFEKEVKADEDAEKEELNIFQELMQAKTTEKDSVDDTLSHKIDKLGELKVTLIEKKGELTDAKRALGQDFEALKKLKETCITKDKEWQEREATVKEEQVAIQDTIKILTNDDNLDLFRKALPSPSFLQLQSGAAQARSKALDLMRSFAGSQGNEAVANRTGIDLVMLELSRRGVDFSSVMKMIDNMTALMDQEQAADDDKKEYCEKQAFENTRKTKALRHKIKVIEDEIPLEESAITNCNEEIKVLQDGIDAMDKAVTESTDIRQKEHEEYQKVVREQDATKQVLLLAKDRMFQFYHPEFAYTTTTTGKYDVEALLQREDPVQPPTFGKSKTVESNGVLDMLQNLVKETDKTVAEAEYNEKDSQKLYEEMLADSKAKRAADVKAIVSQQKLKATAESELVKKQGAVKDEKQELQGAEDFAKDLNDECEWLLKNYEFRKDSRTHEREMLVDAKAILAGA
eukprot:TRINITY_DN3909_c0_g1_i1.p1 TRINITY_DN3909_c0_g1~~TRINITY_DN3909_c0_g1_i1.p1  ORF type:complete len:687 (+),score=246.67 TRINITY_DN3909_c0_g1_i1:106-2166(+)